MKILLILSVFRNLRSITHLMFTESFYKGLDRFMEIEPKPESVQFAVWLSGVKLAVDLHVKGGP
jgi:hypothetical protein